MSTVDYYPKGKPFLVVKDGMIALSSDRACGPWDSTSAFEEWYAGISKGAAVPNGLIIAITQADGTRKRYEWKKPEGEDGEWLNMEDEIRKVIPTKVSDLQNDAEYVGLDALQQAVANAVAALDPSTSADDAIRILAAQMAAETNARSEADTDLETRFNNAMTLLCRILPTLVYNDTSDYTADEGITAAEEFIGSFDGSVSLSYITATFLASGLSVGSTIQTTMFGVTAHYSDGTSASVQNFIISPTVLSSTSNLITVSYGGKTTTVNVPATANAPVAIVAATTNQSTGYVGDAIDLSEITIQVEYSDGTVATYTEATDLIDVSPTTIEAEGENVITISLKEDASITSTVTITGVAQLSLYDVKMLGHYGLEITLTQGSTSKSTDYYYSNANAAYSPVNGKDVNFYNGSITASYEKKMFGDTVLGWEYNGSAVTDTFNITESGILTPIVKGNLMHYNLRGVHSTTIGTLSDRASTTRRYTNPIPIKVGQSIVFKFPDTVAANQTVVVGMNLWGQGFSSLTSSMQLCSLTLDENRECVLDPTTLSFFDSSYTYVYAVITFAQEDTSSSLTSFTSEELRFIEINYANVANSAVPPFHIEEVKTISDTIGTTNGGFSWPRSAAYYNGYYLTFSGQLYKAIIVNTATKASTSKTNLIKYSTAVASISDFANMMCKSASFAASKVNESDFYPILVASWGNDSNKVSFIHLSGTTPTAITGSIICTWEFTGCSGVHVQMKGDDMYVSVSKDTSAESYPESGIYKITGITDADLVDKSVSIVDLGLTRLDSMVPAYTFDSTIIPGEESSTNDMLVTQKFIEGDQYNFFEWEYRHVGTTELSTELVGYMPWTKRITGIQPNGIAYAGNGVFYMSVLNQNSPRTVTIYKVTTRNPQITS